MRPRATCADMPARYACRPACPRATRADMPARYARTDFNQLMLIP